MLASGQCCEEAETWAEKVESPLSAIPPSVRARTSECKGTVTQRLEAHGPRAVTSAEWNLDDHDGYCGLWTLAELEPQGRQAGAWAASQAKLVKRKHNASRLRLGGTASTIIIMMTEVLP